MKVKDYFEFSRFIGGITPHNDAHLCHHADSELVIFTIWQSIIGWRLAGIKPNK
jgi:hypothetical protein